MDIKAVLWDVDDTLFDYTAADRSGMRDHLAAEGVLLGHGSVEEALTRWRERPACTGGGTRRARATGSPPAVTGYGTSTGSR